MATKRKGHHHKVQRPQPNGEELDRAILTSIQQTFLLVALAEEKIMEKIRAGEEPALEREVHQALRSGSLGLLTAYSLLTDLPDPRTMWEQHQQ